MKLSEVAFEKISRGMRVKSDTTGTKGRVAGKVVHSDADSSREDIVDIDWETWDNGYSLRTKHYLCSKITVL